MQLQSSFSFALSLLSVAGVATAVIAFVVGVLAHVIDKFCTTHDFFNKRVHKQRILLVIDLSHPVGPASLGAMCSSDESSCRHRTSACATTSVPLWRPYLQGLNSFQLPQIFDLVHARDPSLCSPMFPVIMEASFSPGSPPDQLLTPGAPTALLSSPGAIVQFTARSTLRVWLTAKSTFHVGLTARSASMRAFPRGFSTSRVLSRSRSAADIVVNHRLLLASDM